MKKFVFLFLITIPLIVKAQNQDSDLKLLISRMQGSFSSEAQAKVDTDYYDIRLHMVQIWPKSTDGYWLYVEQAMSTMMEKPYRQRIYKVTSVGSTLESAVYMLPDAKRFAGAFKNPSIFDSFSKDSITKKEGCSVFMAKFDDTFAGKTGDKTCPSDLRGASYATSKVTIYADKLISWDQGFDKADKQVWGAEKGGYVFDRIKE